MLLITQKRRDIDKIKINTLSFIVIALTKRNTLTPQRREFRTNKTNLRIQANRVFVMGEPILYLIVLLLQMSQHHLVLGTLRAFVQLANEISFRYRLRQEQGPFIVNFVVF